MHELADGRGQRFGSADELFEALGIWPRRGAVLRPVASTAFRRD